MRRVNVVAFAATAALGLLAGSAPPARAQVGVTAFEGARMIVGDGNAMPIDTHVHLSPTRELLTRDLQRSDITNTRRIAAVYLRGAAVDRTQPAR